MMNLQTFLMGLLGTSTLISLATEAVKMILTEHGKSYHANSLAAIVSLVISFIVGAGYAIYANMGFTASTVISIIAFVFMSWLCAMVGYDKVVQTFGQYKTNKEDLNNG